MTTTPDEHEVGAAATLCQTCGEPYQVVRPGKIQPSCDCEYLRRIHDEHDAMRARAEKAERERDVWKARVLREQKITEEMREALGVIAWTSPGRIEYGRFGGDCGTCEDLIGAAQIAIALAAPAAATEETT